MTVDDLKALKWEQVGFGDGSDKLGRFWKHMYRATLPNGEVIEGWRMGGRGRAMTAGYTFRGAPFSKLSVLAEFITNATDVGDDARGVGNDD